MAELLLAGIGGPSDRGRKVRHVIPLDELDNRISYLQSHSIEPSTKSGYLTGARDYITFCYNHKLPLDPTPRTLSRYIAYTSTFIASGPKYLTGARHFLHHLYPDFDKNRSSPLVQSTITGSKKVRADPVHRKLPLRTDHLIAFHELYTRSPTYDHLLFITILSCMFYGCHRSGELVVKTQKAGYFDDARKIIKRGSLRFQGSRAQYNLPYHKGDRFYRGTDVVFADQDIVNPVLLLKQYTSCRDKLHGAKPQLFLRQDGSQPTRSWWDSIFFSVLNRDFGGHSVRAGAATFYASLGVSESLIQALGRWSSEAWRIYIRDNPTIRIELQLAHLRQRH